MATGIALSTRAFRFHENPFFIPKPTILNSSSSSLLTQKRNVSLTICYVADGTRKQLITQIEEENVEENLSSTSLRVAERLAKKKSERSTYLIAALMSSFGITSLAILSVYYRFSWQMEGGDIPVAEMLGTFALSVGAAVGMEFWARWAHKALWHASLWHMHESHHKPREGAFELNDVFAIINAVPAIGLLNYGFFHKGIFPGLCFGALHHSEKFNGVPYGLFLGPMELEEVGGNEELEKEINRRITRRTTGS
ncbi:hypothetical protein IFM89_024659 [Coptis chinensis]|uniref:beta-carotene 3-hydroxylase n=1 Tax=Coptis chinensis TaxID=261450 RepID=A0A835ICP1_9MAGN|nr:hypothetical protein IFM89_024659 [Coptis chinensis]